MKHNNLTGCVIGFITVLLATQAPVYANHFIAGGGQYAVTSNMAETSVRFQFLGVVKGLPDAAIPVIEPHIQFAIVHPDGDKPFRLFTSGTELDPFTVVADPQNTHHITMTGNMLSKLVFGVEPDDQHLTEIVHFEMNAVDAALPGAGTDSMALRLDYSAAGETAARLLETLGANLVTCTADICSLTLTGVLAAGEIESHTAGGD